MISACISFHRSVDQGKANSNLAQTELSGSHRGAINQQRSTSTPSKRWEPKDKDSLASVPNTTPGPNKHCESFQPSQFKCCIPTINNYYFSLSKIIRIGINWGKNQ